MSRPNPIRHALWDVLEVHPETLPVVSTEALRALVKWNNNDNGNFDALTRNELIEVLRSMQVGRGHD